jgi:two-component system CheB/CheR fusion protein
MALSPHAVPERLRILLADDDRGAALALAVGLRQAHHEVDVVLRSEEILNVERLLRPDVVILSATMRGADGAAIAREIRQRHRQIAPLLIEVCGAWTDPAQRWLAEDQGFDHHLSKPCDPLELMPLLSSK